MRFRSVMSLSMPMACHFPLNLTAEMDSSTGNSVPSFLTASTSTVRPMTGPRPVSLNEANPFS